MTTSQVIVEGGETVPPNHPPAPYTLRFTQWQCGHHGTRPADIAVHNIAQAQAIVQAIGYAISQPGSARAVLFNAERGTTIYITDDYTDTIRVDDSSWSPRTTLHHATPEELAELLTLQGAFDYCYGGELRPWDGTKCIEDIDVVTGLSPAEIEAAVAPISRYEADQRRAVCDLPPVIKPVAELLSELREVAQELAAEVAERGGEA
ncbi:hypothetical protein ACN9MJ_10415 [Acidovorax facilis]|uniref:hypothetical protein n=1 Tax=Acidovorax facilis TaxID=12917 RepID=UPI003CE80123